MKRLAAIIVALFAFPAMAAEREPTLVQGLVVTFPDNNGRPELFVLVPDSPSGCVAHGYRLLFNNRLAFAATQRFVNQWAVIVGPVVAGECAGDERLWVDALRCLGRNK